MLNLSLPDTSVFAVPKPSSLFATAVTGGSGVTSASLMPTSRDSVDGIEVLHSTARITPDHHANDPVRLFAPRQNHAPVTSEDYLAKRTALGANLDLQPLKAAPIKSAAADLDAPQDSKGSTTLRQHAAQTPIQAPTQDSKQGIKQGVGPTNLAAALDLHNGVEILPPLTSAMPPIKRVEPTRIFSPRQAPSAISSENFLSARATLSPGFVHNAAQTNMARVSNLYRETPRFHSEIDLLV
jgi:hypothetical protein